MQGGFKAKAPRKIIIVGGGTSGWMTANLMAHQWRQYGIGITLIESARIGTIGVGEGSTPFLKAFFDTLGIAEQTWMPACNASYKCGISFPDWSTVPGHHSYFHPFYCHLDNPQTRQFFANCDDRRSGIDAPALPDDYFISSVLAQQQQAPIGQNDDAQPLDYGYHFDAELLGQFLKQHALGLGVEHIDDTVTKVHQDSEGNIAILETNEHGPLRADFFVDCSGFSGILIQQTLGEKLISSREHLFNDSAVAIQTPFKDSDAKSDIENQAQNHQNQQNQQKIPSHTVSKALKHGWVWHIPLNNRFGNGYVYSADYINKDEAEQELRALLGESAVGQKALHLHWQPGRISQHWKNNCVAIGLSQGFLEPLEAPMLFLTQRSIENFIKDFTEGGFSNRHRQRFNDQINNIIDGTRDYLQAHYKLNSRTDSQYWIDNRENKKLSEPLNALLDGWLNATHFDQVLGKYEDQLSYLKTSWYCLIAGKGYFNPADKPAQPSHQQRQQQALSASQKTAADYFDHYRYLQQLHANHS